MNSLERKAAEAAKSNLGDATKLLTDIFCGIQMVSDGDKDENYLKEQMDRTGLAMRELDQVFKWLDAMASET